MSKLDKIPAILNQRIFKKIFQISEVSKLTEEERMEYESSLRARWDYENALAYTEQVAREEERAIAEAKLAEVEAQAKKDMLNTARELKNMGLSIPEIVKATRLSEEDINDA